MTTVMTRFEDHELAKIVAERLLEYGAGKDWPVTVRGNVAIATMRPSKAITYGRIGRAGDSQRNAG